MRRNTGKSRYMCWMLALLLLAPAAEAVVEDSTVETLKELQELRKEVERRRNEMRRELTLLRQVLGQEVEPELEGGFGALGGMTPDELAAELRILREERHGRSASISRAPCVLDLSGSTMISSVAMRMCASSCARVLN